MSAGALQVGGNPRSLFGPIPLTLFAVVYAFGVVAFDFYAFAALFGAMVFTIFVYFPAFGVYATTALLLLQGSAGVLGVVNDSAPVAITLAQIAGAAAVAAWGMNTLLAKAPFHLNLPIVLLGAFIVWALLSTVMSPDRMEQLPHWARLAFRFAFFLLVVNTINTPQKLRWYVIVMLLSGFVMAAVAVAQYYLPQMQVTGAGAWASLSGVDAAYVDQESLQGEAAIRVSGRAGHSNWLAMILLLLMPMNAWWFSSTKNTAVRGFVLFMTAIEVVALTLTYTRTGLVIGFVLIALVLVRSIVHITPMRLFGFLFAGVVAFALLPDAYKERVLSPKQYTQSQSVRSRVELQEGAARYFAENPIFGLGQGGFGVEFIHERNYTGAMMRFMVEKQSWDAVFVGTHNMYLQLGADSGIVGLALFLGFYIVMVRRLWLAEQDYKARGDRLGALASSTIFISLIGFMLCAVFLHALHQEIWWMVAAAAMTIPIYGFDFREPQPDSAPSSAA